jgi:RNA polymerase sigma-70 factor (ECF subfamily)
MPILTLPVSGVRESFLAAMGEFRAERNAESDDDTLIGRNFTAWGGRWSTPDGFAAFVAAVRAEAEEETPRPEGWVPETTWWWVDGDEYLGRISLRHRLTPRRRVAGGHIGYDVRPTARRGLGSGGRLTAANIAWAHSPWALGLGGRWWRAQGYSGQMGGMEPGEGLARVSSVHTSTGADAAVKALYTRGYSRLVGLLISIGGSRSDAEEVAQDAYAKLLAHWGKVGAYDDPQAWVRAVAVRLLIGRRRRATVAALGLRRLGARPQPEQAALSLDAVAVSTALAVLPVSQRAVIVLHHLLDLPVEEVAAELHIPVGTVKSRLSRARAALAPLLEPNEETIDRA